MQEFLDQEWYYDSPTRVKKPPTSNVKLLPTNVVLQLAQPSRINHVTLNDQLVLNELRPDITRNGILESLVVKIDQRGRMALFDGHHRLVVAASQGLNVVPVVFEKCKSLSVETIHITDIVNALVA